MIEALQFDFMQHALLASLLVSVATGIIGAFVVTNRMVFISGGVAHAAYGGIGLGYFFQFNPLLGAFAFSVLSALGMGVIQRKAIQRTDTLIGVLWAVGMAIGILLIDLTPGYKSDITSYLFGSILAISSTDLLIMAILDLVIIVLVILFYKELVAFSFDETFAEVRNVPVNTLYLVLLSLIAFSVVMIMRMVGLIMVIALLTIPVAMVNLFVRNMRTLMVFSSLLGMIFAGIGLILSYTWNLTSGATIILVAAVSYLLTIGLKKTLKQRMVV